VDSEHADDVRTASGLSIGVLLIGLLIVSPAAYPALAIWATNTALPKAYRLAIVACFFVLLGVAVFWALQRLLGDGRVAAFITFFAILSLTSGGQVLSGWSWEWRWVAAGLIVSLVAMIVLRLKEWWLLDVILVASATALLVPPLLTGLSTRISSAETAPSNPVVATQPKMADRPDIFLIILDGYTSLPVVRELFEFEDESLPEDIAKDGFEVVEPIFSGYSVTQFSLSSFLELDYVAEHRMTSTTNDGRTLVEVLGGDSQLVDMLSSNGYRTTMVEPGWHMSTCGDAIDQCVSDPFIDEGVGTVLSQSLLWSLLEPSVGSAFTLGARNAMSWTVDNVSTLVENGIPDFLFVHVLAPHPPLFLEADCQIASDGRNLGGIYMGVAGVSSETARIRLDGYVNQVECVNGFVRELADAVSGTDSLVFMTGDHGSDVLSQLSMVPEDWSDPQLLERMSVFLAVKTPSGCENQTSLVTVALFRSLVSCAGDVDLAPIEASAFVVPPDEVDGGQGALRLLDVTELTALGSCLAEVDENLDCR
jgi:hypothetical protein